MNGKVVLRGASVACAALSMALVVVVALIVLVMVLPLLGLGIPGSRSWGPLAWGAWFFLPFAGMALASAGGFSWYRRARICVITHLTLWGALFVYLPVATLILGP